MSSVNQLGKKLDLVFAFYPDGQNSNPTYFSIGDGDNQISLSLIQKIQDYAQNGNSSGYTFQDILAEAMYKGLSDAERQLLSLLKASKDSSGQANSQIIVKLDDSVNEDDYKLLRGIPTEDYLKRMKMDEEADFKARDLKKYYKKIDRINGNLPMDELSFEVAGTSTKLSNIHVTDIPRLNELNVHSTVFN